MNVAAWLTQAQCRLTQSSSDSPKLDAEVLASWVLQKNRAWLYGFGDYVLQPEQTSQLELGLSQRAAGYPLAYITGEREFWSLSLATDPSTLIPRADTETLVEWALSLPLLANAQVLDLGTGTGAIALALASEQPSWHVQGVDFQAQAVALAQKNAQRNGLNQVVIFQSDWFSSVTQRYDLIVSNPPYIDADDLHLHQGDVRFEPHSALVADDHGLADLQHIVSSAPHFLKQQGWLLLEHGYQQAEAVQNMLSAEGFISIETKCDLAGHPRITGGCWQPQRIA